MLSLIIVIAVLVVIVVVFASVFSVRSVLPVYHKFDGGEMTATDGAPTADDVLKLVRGKNIFLLSKDDLLDQLNSLNSEWHAIGVVKSFPNILEVHFVKNVAIVEVTVSGSPVYLDCFGYVVSAPSEDEMPLNIDSAFNASDLFAQTNQLGSELVFTNEIYNQRLDYVLQAIMALWQCNCEIQNIPTVLGKTENVFTFDDDGSMIITTGVGAKIYIMEPASTLTDKIINAFSVYCSATSDYQRNGAVMKVYSNGTITGPDDGE